MLKKQPDQKSEGKNQRNQEKSEENSKILMDTSLNGPAHHTLPREHALIVLALGIK